MTRSTENVQFADTSDPRSASTDAQFRPALAPSSDGRSAVRVEGRIRRYLSCLRFEEVLFLQAPPFLGAAFALRDLSPAIAGPLAILTIANLLLMAHVFLLNDWAGLTGDLGDPNKADRVFAARGVSRKEVERISASLLAVSLGLFSYLSKEMLLLATAIAMLSALYSLPRFHWKGRPVLNSVVHLAGGILHFLLGYSLWSSLDGRAFAIAMFFAMTFVAGHLTQEVRDREGDFRNGIRTNAVVFGSRRTFLAGLLLFTVAYAILVLVSIRGFLPLPLAALGFLYPVHLGWSLRTLRNGLTYASIVRLQRCYRALYVVIGLAMVVALSLAVSTAHP